MPPGMASLDVDFLNVVKPWADEARAVGDRDGIRDKQAPSVSTRTVAGASSPPPPPPRAGWLDSHYSGLPEVGSKPLYATLSTAMTRPLDWQTAEQALLPSTSQTTGPSCDVDFPHKEATLYSSLVCQSLFDATRQKTRAYFGGTTACHSL